MKIVQLETENVKRLKAVTITPAGDVVVIGGNNGNGKSSVLDAIEMALGGKNSIPEEPVRRGEESARVVLDLGDMVVKRTFTAGGGSTVTVSSKEGLRYPSPQAVLDALVGRLSFDPLGFMRMKPAEQVATLKQIGGLDFTELDKKRALAYQNRTDASRRTKELTGALAMLPELSKVPDEPVDVSTLMNELKRIRHANSVVESNRMELLRRNANVSAQRAKVANMTEQIAKLQNALHEEVKSLERIEADAETFEGFHGKEATESTDAIDAQIVAAGDINKQVAQKQQRNQRVAELEASRAKEAELSQIITDVDNAKEALLALAKFSVPGLAFSETGVTLNGLPFTQASSAEQLKASVAIGLAQNPKLKVLLIRDGSLLDDASMAAIAVQAADAGAQLWIERVGTDGHTSVIIEDGEIKAERQASVTLPDSATLS